MTNLNEQQCACLDCACIVTVESAIKSDGSLYCSEACSTGHADGEGCCHGCECSGETKH